MRYMMFIKHTQDYGNVQPPAALYEEMGKFIEETTKSGNFVGGAGLQPTSAGTRVRRSRCDTARPPAAPAPRPTSDRRAQ